MSEPLTLTPTSGDSSRKPRQVLELLARWSLPSVPRSLEARLVWFTRGKGTEDIALVSTTVVPAPGARGEHRVRFTLPEAPYSFSGRLISLVWAVELVADTTAARWEFVLAPDGREVLLRQSNDATRPR
jgi:hypothetical protein